MASLALVACIDAPDITGAGTSTDSAATDPSRGGGASAVSRERDGMVLIPAVTVASTGGAGPLAADPLKNAKKDDKDPKDPKDPKDDGGGNPGGGNPGGGNPGGGSPGGGSPGSGNPGGGGAPGGGGDGGRAPANGGANVAIPEFWLDAREVSAAEYRSCLDKNACTAPAPGAGCTLAEGLVDHPVNCVTSDQARAFCTFRQKRLVRGDEWTAAAAGNARRAYPWGMEAPTAERVNACGLECGPTAMYSGADGHVRTAPCGSFPLGRSPEGVEDLGGNVSEWVDAALTPVARGGSFADTDPAAVGATQIRLVDGAGPTVGFRCAADAR